VVIEKIANRFNGLDGQIAHGASPPQGKRRKLAPPMKPPSPPLDLIPRANKGSGAAGVARPSPRASSVKQISQAPSPPSDAIDAPALDSVLAPGRRGVSDRRRRANGPSASRAAPAPAAAAAKRRDALALFSDPSSDDDCPDASAKAPFVPVSAPPAKPTLPENERHPAKALPKPPPALARDRSAHGEEPRGPPRVLLRAPDPPTAGFASVQPQRRPPPKTADFDWDSPSAPAAVPPPPGPPSGGAEAACEQAPITVPKPLGPPIERDLRSAPPKRTAMRLPPGPRCPVALNGSERSVTDAERNRGCAACGHELWHDQRYWVLSCGHIYHKECLAQLLADEAHTCTACETPLLVLTN
jgi:hypothetical protein